MPDPALVSPAAAWCMWLQIKLELESRRQIYQGKNHPCAGGTALWTEYAIFKGLASNGGAAWIGEDDYGVGYFHLTGGQTAWDITEQTWGCGTSPPEPVFLGAGFRGLVVNVYDGNHPLGGSDHSPHAGAPMIPHSGFPVCAALEFEGTAGGYLAFVAGEAAALTVPAAAAACSMTARNQLIVLDFT